MNIISYAGLSAGLAGWVLLAQTFTNLLSGYLDDRTCQTACVQQLYYYAVAAGITGIVLSILSLGLSGARAINLIALIIALPLVAVFVALYVMGNLV